MDVRIGLCHCKLNDKTRELTAFGTPPGQLSIQKTAHGYHTSQQRILSKNDRTIPRGKRGQYYSRWLVEGFGNNSDQAINNHNQNLRAYLQRCGERNIRINLEKCKFLSEEVTYMSHTLTNADLKPGEEKVRAITKFPASHDLHHLKPFIGMVKYFSRFDNSQTTKCEPLNWLTRKNQVFQWAEEQQRAFEDKEIYCKHIFLNLPRLRKASHDTDWHVWCRCGCCPLAEWETSAIRVKGLERLWKEERANWKSDALLCLDYTSSAIIATKDI